MVDRIRGNGLFYGWLIVAVGFFTLFLATGARNAFGVFVIPMSEELDWSRSQLSAAAAIGILMNGLSQPFIGRLYDKFGGRSVISISLAVLGISTMLMSQINSIWALVALFGFVSSTALGGASLVTIHAMVARWFYRRRVMALSLTSAGASAGSLILVPLATYLIITANWRVAWLALGAFIFFLALPLARETGPRIAQIDHRLAELTQRINDLDGLEGERILLDELMRLSGEIEAITASTVYRFSATEAYYPLIGARFAKLREERVKGYSTLGEFLDRRLAPAMRTCESVAVRQEILARRVARAANLLRTRIDITLERQNRDLLASMDQRARLQLRLQKTVEALSVAAITYYLVSLVGYALSALRSSGVEVDVGLVRGLSIPVFAVLAWLGMRWARRAILGTGSNKGGD